MPGMRSLRNRLAVIFALIIIGAIGTIYLSVTPRLEASLTSQRLGPGADDGDAQYSRQLAPASTAPGLYEGSARGSRAEYGRRRNGLGCGSSASGYARLPSGSTPRSS